MENQEKKGCCSSFCLAYTQFNALCRKNAILKLRLWWQLLLELLIPIFFIVAIGGLKNLFKPTTIPKDIPEATFPVPTMDDLLHQTVYPNVLCYDANMFYRCECPGLKRHDYTMGTDLSDPFQAYWENMHSDEALMKLLCSGKIAGSLGGVFMSPLSANQKCMLAQSVLVVCGLDVRTTPMFSTNNNCTIVDDPNSYTTEFMQNSVDTFLTFAKPLNLKISVPDAAINSQCSKQVLALAPGQSTEIQELNKFIQNRYPTLSNFVQLFDSNAKIEDQILKSGYSLDGTITPLIGAAIVFSSGAPSWDYSIRLNTTRQTGTGTSGFEQWAVPTKFGTTDAFVQDYSQSPSNMDGYPPGPPRPFNYQYMTSGALALQMLVDEFIFEQEGIPNKPPAYQLAQFPYASYITTGFWSSVGSLFAIFMVLALMYPVVNMIKALVQEKELKLKEGMKMMGLSPIAHALSWWAHFSIFFLALSILMSASSGNLFEYSDSSLIFWWYMLFNLSSISFSYFISAFFSTARTASIVGALFFFASIFPYFAVSGSSTTVQSKLGACLLPCTCFALGTDVFASFEDSQIGVTQSTVSQQANGNLSFGQILGMLVVDWLIYGTLAWYFNQVIPSEWGTHLKPWFLLTGSYWCPSKVGKDTIEQFRSQLAQKEESVDNPNVQPVSDDLKRQLDTGDCVAIRELGKTFFSSMGTKVAVKDLNLTFYNGQITALLGHNGAGKTTTISMLTGMIPITSGHCFVQGHDVGTEVKRVRESLGVCPQHDILYPELTVYEHLWLFANFKGVPYGQVKNTVNEMIVEVGLTEKRNARAKNLSGGQKRKLSVGIAFIGNSKVVFLDEPTSGMDPYSRRFTWDVIRRNREGRVIVLTTHFMDEADLLGDRIAIMADGGLRCCGSSLYLKNRFGVGYNLTLVKKMKVANSAAILSPLHEGEESKGTLVQVIPKGTSPAEMGNAQSLCDEEGLIDLIQKFVPKNKLLSNVGAEMTFQLPQNSSTAFKPLLSALDAQLNILGVENYGISVTTLEEVFIKVAHGLHEEEEQHKLDVIRQRTKSKSKSFSRPEDDAWKQRRVQGWRLFIVHLIVLLRKRFLGYKRDSKAWLFNVAAPVLFVLIGLGILQIQSKLPNPSHTLNLNSEYNQKVSGIRNPVFYGSNCTASVCPVLDKLMAQMAGATPVLVQLDPTSPKQSVVGQVNQKLYETMHTYAASRYGAYSFLAADSTTDPYEIAVHTNFTGTHAVPLFINSLNSAMLQLLSGSTITTREFPFPLTTNLASYKSSASGFVVTLFIVFAVAFVPATFAQFIVYERESKTKHQQVVSGVSLNGYWLSSYIWDFFQFLFGPMLFIIILLAIFSCDSLIGKHVGQGTFILFLLFGYSLIPFTYLTTFFFKSAAMSTVLTILINWVLGLLLMILVFLLSVIPKYQKIARKIRFAFRIFPQFCFADGLLHISSRLLFGFVDSSLGTNPSIWLNQMIGYDLAYMAWEGPIYFIMVLILERIVAGSTPLAKKINKLQIKNKGYKPAIVDPSMVDEDVLAEEQRVMGGGASQDVIQIHNLRKAYANPMFVPGCKEAVKGVTLGIPRGQCFGLLGINGAGKTTTLSVLSGEIPPTDGFGTLAGLDIATQAEELHKLVGYCPQFDAIFVKLTARENLQLYGRLKGIPSDMIDKLVNETLKEMSLEEYADRLSGGFSGGNKRKLSVGIAMIGGPELIFLDEPSTGMDPVARRFMWDVITRISTQRAQCAIILTTHSMEECEALCTRIGIMVGGRLRCLGTAQRLKTRFGLGFQLEVGLQLPTEKEVAQMEEFVKATQKQSGMLIMVQDKLRILNEGLADVFSALANGNCGLDGWRDKFAERGSGAMLYLELMAAGSVKVQDLASFICLEQRSMDLENFVSSTFQGAILRERQSGKARFEYPPQNMSIGNMFGILEESRSGLKIEEYSLSQTTLEQIFNFFASQQEEETGHVAGMVSQSRPETAVVPVPDSSRHPLTSYSEAT